MERKTQPNGTVKVVSQMAIIVLVITYLILPILVFALEVVPHLDPV